MYLIKSTRDYERSYKKLVRSGVKPTVLNILDSVIDTLAKGEALDDKYKDHRLAGDLKDYRECHIKPDLLLVYKALKNDLILILVNLGSHSDLFG